MFDDFLRDFDVPGRGATAWPHIEISETHDEIKVVAELAGLEQRDVDVTLDEGVLTLKGQKSLEKNGTLYSERWERAFERTIPVGQGVDPEKVKASFKNGVLTVRLPAEPRRCGRWDDTYLQNASPHQFTSVTATSISASMISRTNWGDRLNLAREIRSPKLTHMSAISYTERPVTVTQRT